VKSSLVGCSTTVPIEDGKMALGTWQGIYFAEFDGPRSRQCIVTVMGE
jgi:secondary thiamine-phosphate synthase enzyme